MATALKLDRRETMILGLHILAIFIIPHLPAQVLLLTDTILVRFLLLAAVLASAYTNAVLAIATFVVVALLFVERNKVKMRVLQTAMSQSTPDSPAIESIQTPETAPEQPPFEKPVSSSIPFMPQPDAGDDTFAPVAESLNEKTPLPTEGSNDGVAKAISQLYTWVNPNLIQQG